MRIKLIFSIFFLSFINLQSQTLYKEISEYQFIDLSANKIDFPAGKEKFDILFDKLDNIIVNGKGNINILHIGGSHIQADVYSNQLRENLLNFFPGITSGRGLVFPYSAAKTNNPYNYISQFTGKWEPIRNIYKEFPYPLGVSGIAITSNDPAASITIKIRDNTKKPYFDFNRIRIIGSSDSMSIEPILVIDSLFALNGIHDSASGSFLFELTNYVDSLTIKFINNDTLNNPFVLRGIILENDFPGISYHSVGVNGASVPSYLKCEYWERELELISPDLVIFGIGVNDASGDNFSPEAFKRNYDMLLSKILNVNPNCAFIFVTNNDTYRRIRRRYYVNNNGPIVKQAFYELAEKYNSGVWDLFSIMGGLKSIAEWEKAGLANRDKIHFKSNGYKLLGDMMYNAIIDEYINHINKASRDN